MTDLTWQSEQYQKMVFKAVKQAHDAFDELIEDQRLWRLLKVKARRSDLETIVKFLNEIGRKGLFFCLEEDYVRNDPWRNYLCIYSTVNYETEDGKQYQYMFQFKEPKPVYFRNTPYYDLRWSREYFQKKPKLDFLTFRDLMDNVFKEQERKKELEKALHSLNYYRELIGGNL